MLKVRFHPLIQPCRDIRLTEVLSKRVRALLEVQILKPTFKGGVRLVRQVDVRSVLVELRGGRGEEVLLSRSPTSE